MVSGAELLLVWLGLSILPAMVQGQAPAEVWSYTTVVTYAIDLGVIVLALILAGLWLLRCYPAGYLASGTMLAFAALLGAVLLAAGTAQLLAGLTDPGQFVAFTVSFALLTLIALGLTMALLRSVDGTGAVVGPDGTRREVLVVRGQAPRRRTAA